MGNTNISTNVHQLGMTLMWTGVSTVMLMAILLRDYSKAWLVHAILGSLILLVTFTFMLLFLIPLPFPPEGQGTLVYVHGILGATIITFIGFQVFGGFYGLWFQRQRQNNPQDIQNRKLGHKILGYIIMVILKINVLVMWVGYGYWQIALNWEFLGILTWVFLKMLRPKIVNGKTIMEKAPRVIGSLKQIQADLPNDYVIFADQIYMVSPLLDLHPAGFKIIESVLGREIDRFVYGMYAPELLPDAPLHEHSSNFTNLVGSPLARIDTPSPYHLWTDQVQKAEVKEIFVVSEPGSIYELRLRLSVNKSVCFTGYTDKRQFGQYYTLTLNNSLTRLYTSVHCLQKRNLSLMETLIKGFTRFQKNLTVNNKQNENIELANDRPSISPMNIVDHGEQDTSQECTIPLLMKIYPQGQMTRRLRDCNFNPKQLQMSCLRGQGLCLATLPPGKVIIVAGGTGLFPFMDLIDQLYKDARLKIADGYSAQIINENPLLAFKPFKGFTFVLMGAFNSPEDIHPLTLRQIGKLVDQHHFRAILRVKENPQFIEAVSPKISLTNERFDKMIIAEAKTEQLSRIYICGPPRMNTDTAKSLLAAGFNKNHFLLV